MNTARRPAIQAIAPPREDGVPGTRARERAAFAARLTGLAFRERLQPARHARDGNEHGAREHERKQDHEASRLGGFGAAHCQRNEGKDPAQRAPKALTSATHTRARAQGLLPPGAAPNHRPGQQRQRRSRPSTPSLLHDSRELIGPYRTAEECERERLAANAENARERFAAASEGRAGRAGRHRDGAWSCPAGPSLTTGQTVRSPRLPRVRLGSARAPNHQPADTGLLLRVRPTGAPA